MAASQFLDVPGYSALILRRSYSDLSLPGALMSRSREWWGGTNARWVEDEKTWYFPTKIDGEYSTITFGYIEHEKDKFRYQSSEFQFVGFDELTQFSETMYLYMFSRIRRTTRLAKMGVPLRIRSASNPGNMGHQWVKDRFIQQIPWLGDNGDRLEYIQDEDGDRLYAPIFIPANLHDNPYLDEQTYRRGLKGLDAATREQLLHGDWNVAATGAQFVREWFDIIPVIPNTPIVRAVRNWDLAATKPVPGQRRKADWTAGALVLKTEDGDLIIADVKRFQEHPGGVQNIIRQTAINDQAMMDRMGVTVEVSMEQDPGAAGKMMIEHYSTKVLPEFPFYPHRPTGKKEVRSVPFANQAKAKKVCLVGGEWCRPFLDEIELFPFAQNDDQVDAASGAVNRILSGQDLRMANSAISNMFSWRD